MGLNPAGYGPPTQKQIEARERKLADLFNGSSPYFDMFTAGVYGIDIEVAIEKCKRNNIAIRFKDIENYENGKFQRWMNDGIPGAKKARETSFMQAIGIEFEESKLSDYPLLPIGWKGCEKRFFPCTADNRPMQKWGWSDEFTPQLYSHIDAKSLSPIGWVGQNMLYQKFVVFDIDGVGHGQQDKYVIEFGNIFRDTTMTMEDPNKPGSFHLYFETDRLIPVRHFPYAKLDLMGNAVNAAVYLKNKKWNNIPMRMLDQEIWDMLQSYLKFRKENLHESQSVWQ